MSYTVEKMSGEPVVLVRLNSDYDAVQEMQDTIQSSNALIAQQTEPVFSIWDVDQSNVNLEGLMSGTNVARQETATPPNQMGSIILGNSPYLQLLAQGLNSDTYGHLNIRVFGQLDEALAYVHEQMKKRAST